MTKQFSRKCITTVTLYFKKIKLQVYTTGSPVNILRRMLCLR